MIDGYKTYNLSVNIDELNNNILLSFNRVSNKDGEITTEFAYYKGQTFTIKDNKVRLNGSFHKYFNNGVHNYNDFYFTDLKNVLIDLSTKFNINPEKTILNNLEFGVNVFIRVEPEEVFKNIINYKGKPFHKFNVDGAKGIECQMQNFIIKIYDKGYQYKQSGNLLRFELKGVKMQYFTDNKIKIKTFADLLNVNQLHPLKDVLVSVFNEILITDYCIKDNKLNAKELLIFSNGNNPKYWEQLIPKSKLTDNSKNKDYKKQRKNYYRELNRFKKLIQKYSVTNLQNNISNLIEKKCIQLLEIESKKGDKLTDYLEPNKTPKKGQINTLNIVVNCPLLDSQKKRYCLTCKKDISEKKLTAKYCSKKCKNDHTNKLLNPRNNLLKSIKNLNSYPVLFDTNIYIQLSIQKKDLLNKPNSIYN